MKTAFQTLANSLTLVSISEVKTEKERVDNKKSREYYTAEFRDINNPFAPTVKRNFFQAHDESGQVTMWKGADPKSVASFIGKQIPGQIVKATVLPYKIGDRTVDSYTTAVLAHETAERVFKAAGHEVVDATTGEVVVNAEDMTILNG